MTTELKPCPAGHATTIYRTDDDGYCVCCKDSACGWCIDDVFTSESEAIAVWNTRHEEDRLRARIAELEAGYQEALVDIESWASYAGDYFQKKHRLRECLDDHASILAGNKR